MSPAYHGHISNCVLGNPHVAGVMNCPIGSHITRSANNHTHSRYATTEEPLTVRHQAALVAATAYALDWLCRSCCLLMTLV